MASGRAGSSNRSPAATPRRRPLRSSSADPCRQHAPYTRRVPFVDPAAMLHATPLPGWHGRFFHSDTMTFSHYDIAADAAPLHEHHHPQEEVWHVVDGEVLLTIDGVEQAVHAGGVAVVPPDTPHSVRIRRRVPCDRRRPSGAVRVAGWPAGAHVLTGAPCASSCCRTPTSRRCGSWSSAARGRRPHPCRRDPPLRRRREHRAARRAPGATRRCTRCSATTTTPSCSARCPRRS